MELGGNFFLRETCKLNHKYQALPSHVEHEFNATENQHYLVQTFECITCGHIKLVKIKVNY